MEMWKPTEPLTLIDLGDDFYIAKFTNPENMQKALHSGSWFVTRSFLSVRHWEPNFILEEATQSHTAIWIRLPHFPTEFYDKKILERIGNKLGTLLKIDTCTSTTLRGRYARIYIQVPLDEPVKTFVNVDTHRQSMIYEGEVSYARDAEDLAILNTPAPRNPPKLLMIRMK